MAETNFYPKVNSRIFAVKRVPVAGVKPLVIIANKLSDGSAEENKVYENIAQASVDSLFGVNSNLSKAINVAFDIDKTRIISAIAINDGLSDVQATATITLAGEVSKTRQAVIKSGNDVYSINITSGASLSSIILALKTAIENATSKRFNASASASTLTLTSLHKGACGNNIPLEIYFLDENSVRINELTLTYSGFSGGSGTPSITNALSVLNEFDVEIAIDTSFILDVANASLFKSFLKGRLNSDNAIKNGFGYIHYVDSISGLTAKFSNSAFGDVPLAVISSSKAVSKTGKSGAEDGNYPLDVAVAISCINSAIITDGSDVSEIMPHKPIGSITNQGVARGGMVLPNLSISSDISEGWISSEISSLEDLKINAVRTRNGSLEIGEMFTQSTEESYQSFPEMSIATRVQSDIFLLSKKQSNKIINDRVKQSIRGVVITYINTAASTSNDWLSDDSDDIKNMIKSISIARQSSNPNVLVISLTIKTVNCLKVIPVNIFVNTLNL